MRGLKNPTPRHRTIRILLTENCFTNSEDDNFSDYNENSSTEENSPENKKKYRWILMHEDCLFSNLQQM